MVIFAALAMVVVIFAGALLLLLTDGATDDASDGEIYTFLGILGLGTPLLWSVLNLLLLRWRRQTGGQYVAGVRLAREDGAPVSTRDLVVWWLCLNPLLFSWPMAAVTVLPLTATAFLALSRGTIVVFGGLVVLCLLAPVIALVSALFDVHNRALHDRVVGTVVVPSE
jgi:uncharacterized RDD family membrane protein YckC